MRRGFGASQRDVDDLSLEAQTSDIAAVFDALDLNGADLWAFGDATAPCVAFTVQNPERVNRLAIYSPYVRGRDFMPEGAIRSLMDLCVQNWGMARRAMADVVFPSGPVDEQRWLSEQWKESITPEMQARYLEFGLEVDLTQDLPQVQVPTLVVTRRGDRFAPPAQGRAVAGLIPNARFVAIEGDIAYAWFGDVSYIDTVKAFLDEGRAPATAATTQGSPVQTILFTDLEGHTAIMSRLGDERGRALLREHERVTREALTTHGGREVKSMGDGFMATFSSAQRAVECAIALQQAISSLGTAEYGLSSGLKVRAGLNAGEPIVEDDDLFGSSVIAAARIASKAQGGQVLVSDVVRQLVAGKGFLFHDTGQHDLKGLEEPMRLWELRLGP
jgi:class 3 adenylate cyclase